MAEDDPTRAVDPNTLHRLRMDFFGWRNKPCKHFPCPISLEDSYGARGLMNGHILNRAFDKANGETVIQRADIDGYYGETVEPDLITYLNSAVRHPSDWILSSKEIKAITSSGIRLDAFIPSPKSKPPEDRFTPIPINDEDTGKVLATPYVRASLAELGTDSIIRFEGTKTLNQPSMLGAWMKAGYLAMWKMFGCRYADTLAGNYVRYPLYNFFKDKGTKSTAENYFRRFEGAANILFNKDFNPVIDTIENGYFLTHIDGSLKNGIIFAMSCVFRINGYVFTVTLPSSRDDLDFAALCRYVDYLKDEKKPGSIHLTQFKGKVVHISPTPFPMNYVKGEAEFVDRANEILNTAGAPILAKMIPPRNLSSAHHVDAD